MKHIVIKRDGSEESFDKNKIARVVNAAGLEPQQATELAEKVNSWVEKQPQKVTSLQIRDEVLKELKTADQYAANMFEWYEKTKDK